MGKQQLIRWIEAHIARATSRRYRIQLDALDIESLREVQRLLRDLESEQRNAARRAQTMPWRRA
jgi:hypothetical protein